jgi:hypothetical protein
MPVWHVEHRLAEPLRPLIGIPLATLWTQSAVAAKGDVMILVAVWTVASVTASIWTFAVHHLLHFFSLYWPYLPAMDKVLAVPIVISGEDDLYWELRPRETANLFWWRDIHFFHNVLRKGKM